MLAEIAALGYTGVGRKYGVSDNAVRKWRRAYEAEAITEAPVEPDDPAEIPLPTGAAPDATLATASQRQPPL